MASREEMWSEILDLFESHSGLCHDCGLEKVPKYLARNRNYQELVTLHKWLFTKFFSALELYKKAVEHNLDVKVALMYLRAVWDRRPQ
jgi:hypothetical protein